MRIIYLIGGGCGIMLGLLTIIKGGFNHHGIFINLPESKYLVGGIFIIIGMLFFFIALRWKEKP